MYNKYKIEKLAKDFRRGIEKTRKDGRFPKRAQLNNFPIGCCGDASDLLAQYLFEHDIHCSCVCGSYVHNDNLEESYSHEWLEIDEKLIVDITADQFKYYNNSIFNRFNFLSCYVGEENNFYRMFMQRIIYKAPFYGLQGFNDDYCRLQELYNIIIDSLKF